MGKQTCMVPLCGMPCSSKAREKHCAQLLHNPLLNPGPLPHCHRNTPPRTASCLFTGAPQIPPSRNFCFCLCRTSLPLPPLLKLLSQRFHTSHFSQNPLGSAAGQSLAHGLTPNGTGERTGQGRSTSSLPEEPGETSGHRSRCRAGLQACFDTPRDASRS